MAVNLGVSFNAQDKVSPVTRKMNRNVSRFSKRSKRSFRSVGSSINNMRRLLVGAGAVLATGKLARGVTRFTEKADDIAKTSRQIGIASDSLQSLTFAAERQGVEADTLKKSLKAMNNRLGLLRNGQGQLNTLLKDTNPQLREQLTTAESSEEAFKLLMDSINNAGTAAEKTALAQAAFSSSGRELVRMSEVGSEGLSELQQEARDLGLVMGEETLASAEKFQDGLSNLKAVGTGVIQSALAPMIPKMTELVSTVSDWIQENRGLIKQRIGELFDRIKQTVMVLARAWKSGLIPAVLASVAAFKLMHGAVNTARAAFEIYHGRKTAYIAVTKGATTVTAAFNAVLAANPINAIILGIVALIAVIILLVRNWDKVTAALKRVWNWFSNILDNPLIATTMAVFAPLLTIPALIVKNWEKVKSFFATLGDFIKNIWDGVVSAVMGTIEKVIGAIKRVKELGQDIGGRLGEFFGGEDNGSRGGIVSANQGMIESRQFSESRSNVDVNLAGLPQGSTVRQRGEAPGVNVNYGFAQGGL